MRAGGGGGGSDRPLGGGVGSGRSHFSPSRYNAQDFNEAFSNQPTMNVSNLVMIYIFIMDFCKSVHLMEIIFNCLLLDWLKKAFPLYVHVVMVDHLQCSFI